MLVSLPRCVVLLWHCEPLQPMPHHIYLLQPPWSPCHCTLAAKTGPCTSGRNSPSTIGWPQLPQLKLLAAYRFVQRTVSLVMCSTVLSGCACPCLQVLTMQYVPWVETDQGKGS